MPKIKIIEKYRTIIIKLETIFLFYSPVLDCSQMSLHRRILNIKNSLKSEIRKKFVQRQVKNYC